MVRSAIAHILYIVGGTMHQSQVFANQFACVYYLFLHTLATIHLALLCGVETVIH